MRFALKRQESRQSIGRAQLIYHGEALDNTREKVITNIVNCLLKGSDLAFSMQRGGTGSSRKDMGGLLDGVRAFCVSCRLSESFPMIHHA